jgi:hypothetical protein
VGLKEISLAQLLNSTSGTNYFVTFAKLIGHSENSVFYEGITDDDYYLLEELEEKHGYELPSNYIEFLNYLNGGRFLGMDFFSLVEKNYPNSLYNRNFINTVRDQLDIDDSALLIGKYENYVMYVDCLGADGSYTLMDIRNNEKIEFESFNSLVGFIFYILVVNTNKKLEEEKEQIKEMKDKLHSEFVAKNKEWKKEKERNSAKIRAKAAANGLKKKQRKKMK